MAKTLTQPEILQVAALPHARDVRFDIALDGDARAGVCATLDLIELRKLRFQGTLSPMGKRDWQLSATLGATAVQACVVTLDPVVSRVDAPVERRFLADMAATPDLDEGSEMEMPEDDTSEPLPAQIDLAEVITESLALALPDYPRAAGAELGTAQFAEDGTTPLSDADVKPFAGLAALRDKLSGDG